MQSGVIFLALVVLFVVWAILNGKLPAYARAFGLSTQGRA